MILYQHAQARLSNGMNISLEVDEHELVLNKTLRIPLKELNDFCTALQQYAGPHQKPAKQRGGRQHYQRTRPQKPIILRDALLTWEGPAFEEIPRYFPGNSRGSRARQVAEVCAMLLTQPMQRGELQEQIVKELKVPERYVVSTISVLLHTKHFLQVANPSSAPDKPDTMLRWAGPKLSEFSTYFIANSRLRKAAEVAIRVASSGVTRQELTAAIQDDLKCTRPQAIWAVSALVSRRGFLRTTNRIGLVATTGTEQNCS